MMSASIKMSDVRFDALLKLAIIENFEDELTKLPSNDELEGIIAFSVKHERKMKRLFVIEQWVDAYKMSALVLKYAVIFTVFAVTVFFGLLLTKSDIRAAVRKTAVEWLENFTRFSFNNESGSIKGSHKEWRPGYLPGGFKECDSYVYANTKAVEYVNDEHVIIIFEYAPADGSAVYVDNEYAEYSCIEINEIIYYLFDRYKENRHSIILWEHDGISFTIESLISGEELLRMASSTASR